MISYYTGRLRVEDQARDEHAPEGDAGDPADEGGAAVERPLAEGGQARPRLLPALQGQGGGPQEVQHAPQGRAVMHGGLLCWFDWNLLNTSSEEITYPVLWTLLEEST